MALLLLVDDEANILSALKRTLMAKDEFSDQAEHYRIDATTSVSEALKMAETTDYDLIISDYRMPEMDGVRLLADLRYRRPDAVRMILSGMADMDGLIRAINGAEIYRFMSKPWDDDDMRATVAGALAHRRMLRDRELGL